MEGYQPLLSEAFPQLAAQLTEWMEHDRSEKGPGCIHNKKPDLYGSKAHPDQPVGFVDCDGVDVNVGLCSLGMGNKHVIVAHGSSLEPAIITYRLCLKVPKCYSAYFKWTSATTWIEQPCVLKVFGKGPRPLAGQLVESLREPPKIPLVVQGT